ncbi:hypothetical protein NDI53_02915 [Leptolyngbya sp. NM3-A1]
MAYLGAVNLCRGKGFSTICKPEIAAYCVLALSLETPAAPASIRLVNVHLTGNITQARMQEKSAEAV